MSIVSKLLSSPSSFSIEMLQRGVQSGTVPAYIGIPLIQQKMQEKKAMAGMQARAGMQQQQLGFLNAMIRGMATPTTTVESYQAAPSLTSQLAGLGTAGIAGLGMYNAMNKA